MKNIFVFFKASLIFIFASFSCNVSYSEPPNLELLKSDIRQWHDAGLYEQAIDQEINSAQRHILEQVKINEAKQIKMPLAIVLDIDETTLSNYKFIDQSDFTKNLIEIERHMQDADSPPIEATLKLYKEAARLGVKVFFVTGRSIAHKEITEQNLLNAGFSHWEGIYLKPIDSPKGSSIPFKTEARADIERKGFKIIANIGDQYSDLLGGHAQKTFKLPNPYYYLP